MFKGGLPLAIFGGAVVFLRSLLFRGGGGWVSFGGRPGKNGLKKLTRFAYKNHSNNSNVFPIF